MLDGSWSWPSCMGIPQVALSSVYFLAWRSLGQCNFLEGSQCNISRTQEEGSVPIHTTNGHSILAVATRIGFIDGCKLHGTNSSRTDEWLCWRIRQRSRCYRYACPTDYCRRRGYWHQERCHTLLDAGQITVRQSHALSYVIHISSKAFTNPYIRSV